MKSSSSRIEGVGCGLDISKSLKPCDVSGLDDARNVGVANATGIRNVGDIWFLALLGASGMCGVCVTDKTSFVASWDEDGVW